MKFLTTFISVFAMISAAAHAETAHEAYQLELSIEENGAVIAQPTLIARAGEPYTLDLPSGDASYQLIVEVAGDTEQAAQRIMGDAADSFVFVNTALSMRTEPLEEAARQTVLERGLLVITRYERAMRARTTLYSQNLQSSTGKRLESLEVSVIARPASDAGS